MTKRAFVIGINTLGLQYCDNDALSMSRCLKQYGYEVSATTVSESKRDILARFDDWIESCHKTDTVIFYFSGHGSLKRGQLELLLADDAKRQHKIPISEIIDGLEDCVARHKLIILDCCSAGASQERWQYDPSDAYRILVASGRLEKAKELAQEEAGFLTHHLYQTLMSPPSDALDEEHHLRINALHEQLVQATKDWNGGSGSEQMPMPDLLGGSKANFEIVTVSPELRQANESHVQKDRTQMLQEERSEVRYRTLALESCDIIDLANLPESDRHIATRQLELRQLYVPLRVTVESSLEDEVDESRLEALEKRRGKFSWDQLENAQSIDRDQQYPVGERLATARRLVILGDPGAGKTTIIRWIATAYLLRLKEDSAWQALPDVMTLPDQLWLPIFIRCRDLTSDCLQGGLDDILDYTLRKAEMTSHESALLRELLRDKLKAGQALLLIDGLDEITDPAARIRFCRQIEQMQIAYPNAPMIVTSRIVGYREMGYRIKRGFEHVTVADFSAEDKDTFARRWCGLVEPPERREKATTDLISDIHSSDRIERLTSNPMLLTTMALVKRKVGKLPNRRAELYYEAVQVLLNWRSDVDEPIDRNEAVPQLEYIAYAMCDRGVQQLREDEIIELLTQMRAEYPHIYPVQRRDPDEFLRLLERRTGILIEAGHIRHLGRPAPVFEFRHLTFQEYLAGLALVDKRFPQRDSSLTLAQSVAPLAGRVSVADDEEAVVVENWREALRLCVASCNHDDVDALLKAILTPLPDEIETDRPRAVLAALCLADEPNVATEVAQQIILKFVAQVGETDGAGSVSTSVDKAALELVNSQWVITLEDALVTEFCRRGFETRNNPGGLYAMLQTDRIQKDEECIRRWLAQRVDHIRSGVESQMVGAALGIMLLAFQDKALIVPDMIDGLLSIISGSPPASHAAVWALCWLNRKNIWEPTVEDVAMLIEFCHNRDADINPNYLLSTILGNVREKNAVEILIEWIDHPYRRVKKSIIETLGQIGDTRAVKPLIAKLDDPDNIIFQFAAYALGQIGDVGAVESLIAKLDDPDNNVVHATAHALGQIGDGRVVEPLQTKLSHEHEDVRKSALGGLAMTCDDEIDRKLLSSDIDELRPFLDPKQEIGAVEIERAMEKLELTEEEVKRRYEALAARFQLKLAWQSDNTTLDRNGDLK